MACAFFLNLGTAQAICQFGAPLVGALDAYTYVSPWTQTVQLPVTCTMDSPVGAVHLGSPSGALDAATGRFTGRLSRGSDTLNYVIQDATRLRVVSDRLTLLMTVPAGQWGAPTGLYTDTLTITVDF